MKYEYYEALLTQRLHNITEELKTVGIHNPTNNSDWIPVPESTHMDESDDNLAADAIEASDERQSLVATFEQDYNALTLALKRIENGTFGLCEICGVEIETMRLEAQPAARTCVAHKDEEMNLL